MTIPQEEYICLLQLKLQQLTKVERTADSFGVFWNTIYEQMWPARCRHKLGRWKAWRESRVRRGTREEGENEVTIMNAAPFTLVAIGIRSKQELGVCREEANLMVNAINRAWIELVTANENDPAQVLDALQAVRAMTPTLVSRTWQFASFAEQIHGLDLRSFTFFTSILQLSNEDRKVASAARRDQHREEGYVEGGYIWRIPADENEERYEPYVEYQYRTILSESQGIMDVLRHLWA
ncbi:hypothetical protein OIDMADRAFT_28822 [Oidiodendron maius Zn]|uniref:Uncharacterized protein n=1 Tax=Oidiodendron maius (strain Zn) TaxID=913774 RepID=A0A0C3GYT3_OIDMZ|nr:hypothetical protein OIDMADRAFT_28822 [Oidiodendron maius Zn]